MIIRFDVSPEQEDVIADYLLEGGELGILPDERAWILAQARKQVPGCRITNAELHVEAAQWVVEIQ